MNGVAAHVSVARLFDLVKEELTEPAHAVVKFLLFYLGVPPCVAIGLYDGCYSRCPKYSRSVLLVVCCAAETLLFSFGRASLFIFFIIDDAGRLVLTVGVLAFLVGAPSLAFLGL